MTAQKVLDKFIKFFYICGMSCYRSFDEFSTDKPKPSKIARYGPTLVLTVIIVVAALGMIIKVCACEPNENTWWHFEKASLSAIPVSTVLVSAIQMFFLSPHFAEICLRISDVERLAQRTVPYDFNKFSWYFIRRFAIMTLAYLASYIHGILFLKYTTSQAFARAGTGIIKALILLELLQVLFYIDLLNFLLHRFVRHLGTRAATTEMPINALRIMRNRNPAAIQLIDELFHIKLMHFTLWEISNKINQLFGWTIFMIFLLYFWDIVMIAHIAWTSYFAMKYDELTGKEKFIVTSCDISSLFNYSTGACIYLFSYVIIICIFTDSCHRCAQWVTHFQNPNAIC